MTRAETAALRKCIKIALRHVKEDGNTAWARGYRMGISDALEIALAIANRADTSSPEINAVIATLPPA